jgi:hypothetical protein
MKAKFTRRSEGQLGILFEPETFDEQLLLEIFTRNSCSGEFRFSSWEHNQARTLREGLTACWGEIVAQRVPEDASRPAE